VSCSRQDTPQDITISRQSKQNAAAVIGTYRPANVIHNNGCLCSTVVHGSKTVVPLLTCCVPDLERDVLAVCQLDGLGRVPDHVTHDNPTSRSITQPQTLKPLPPQSNSEPSPVRTQHQWWGPERTQSRPSCSEARCSTCPLLTHPATPGCKNKQSSITSEGAKQTRQASSEQ